jgi:hypothetical protein
MVHDPVAQEAARAIGFALIGLINTGNMNLRTDNALLIKPAVQTVLDAAAEVSGHPEIANAPLCITGLSSGAFGSSGLARHWPERVIAFVCHRGNDFTNPVLSAPAKKVPGLMVAGSTDGNDLTEPSYMQTRFRSWRSQGAQVAYAVDWGVGHTMRGNQGWEATFTWFVEVANLRYPRPSAPSLISGADWPALIELADNSGWLGDRPNYPASTPFAGIKPFADYSGTVTNASWLPNETCARMYRALTSTDRAARTVVPLQTPLRITSPAQYADAVTVGEPVTIELDPREFDNTNALVSVEFYDGAALLGTDSTGPEWSVTFAPTGSGLHTLTLVAADTMGNQQSAFRTLYVVPADFPPLTSRQDATLAAGTGLTGTLTGSDPEGGAVTFALLQAATNGALTFSSATGEYFYQPAHGYSGQDTFTFAPVCNGVTGAAAIATIAVNPAVDVNTNGLPDTWETAHSVTNAAADDDGDGFSNRQEYQALTNPQDDEDFPRVQAVIENSSGAPFTLQWPAKGGVRYRVLYSDDLSAWTEIQRSANAEIQPGAYGADGTGAFADDWTLTEPPPASRRFYRIRVL